MSIIISFIEILSIFLIYNLLTNKYIFSRVHINILSGIFTSLLYYLLVYVYSVDQVIALIAGVFLIAILISKLDSKDTILAFTELIVSFIIVSIFELVGTFIIHIFVGDKDISEIIYFAILIITMFVLIFLLNKYSKVKNINISGFLSKYRSINIIVLNLFVFCMCIKVLIVNELMKTNIVIQITILGLILVGINCYFYVFLYNTLNEKKKNEIKKSFNPLINDLMGKLKANEHEYKNHLNTIWSIAQVCKPEEIGDKLKEYITNIVDDTEEFSMLLNVENTIIKAVLYNKGQRAEKLGVKYNYKVTSDFKEVSLDNSELTVILSNLLNNAIEATSLIKKKELEVKIEEDDKNYIIDIRNYTEGTKVEQLPNMFKMGYTTKGEGRGYGLYNVKKIVDKHKGKIVLDLNDDIMNIKVLFPR
ncbi:MAG: GHKL domain-containing protein [Clostridium sp.]|nr:GHKL domain-containing protein [Clostridium sp.]